MEQHLCGFLFIVLSSLISFSFICLLTQLYLFFLINLIGTELSISNVHGILQTNTTKNIVGIENMHQTLFVYITYIISLKWLKTFQHYLTSTKIKKNMEQKLHVQMP